jgi:hypothetical protein
MASAWRDAGRRLRMAAKMGSSEKPAALAGADFAAGALLAEEGVLLAALVLGLELALVLAFDAALVVALEGGLEDFLELPAAFMQGSCSVIKRSANCSLAGPIGFAAWPHIQPPSTVRAGQTSCSAGFGSRCGHQDRATRKPLIGNAPFHENATWCAGLIVNWTV